MPDMTFAGWRAARPASSIEGMDTLSMVLVAMGSFALLQLAAVNLRGDERRHRSTRSGARPPSRR
jgi:hypothetical protein